MKISLYTLLIFPVLFVFLNSYTYEPIEARNTRNFQGKAYYFAKSSMDLGKWGARLSEAQKKQIKERLKNRLEKSYLLEFNKTESVYKEEDKLDAMSGATDSWGKNFAPGLSYKNMKEKVLIQNQEFYGKKFLVKDSLLPINWALGSETKKIGEYTCFKAVGTVPTKYLNWYSFNWNELRKSDSTETNTEKVKMANIEAWYAPQIPVSSGPAEFGGLPGLILEVTTGKTTLLCYKIVLNPDEKSTIEAPDKGKEVSKLEYKSIITNKMKEFRDNRMGRR